MNQAPATTDPGYVSGVAAGGNGFANGGNGLLLINSIGGSITEGMRIGSNGYVGIGTTTPAANLDVAGIGRFFGVSTLTQDTGVLNAEYISSQTILSQGLLSYEILASSISTDSIVAAGTICTNSLVVYGPSTFTNLGSTILSGPVFVNAEITGTNNLVTSSMLVSTVAGLGQIYPSTTGGGSAGPTSTLSSQQLFTSSIFTNSLQIGEGTGWVAFNAPLYTPGLSTMQVLASSVQTSVVSTLQLYTSSINNTMIFTSTVTANSFLNESTMQIRSQRFDPRSIQGLQMWLDSSDPSTFRFQTGSNIGVWLDKSGQGNHAVSTGVITASTNAVVMTGTPFTTPLNASGFVNNIFKEYGFIVFTTAATASYGLLGINPGTYQGRTINTVSGNTITQIIPGGGAIASVAVGTWNTNEIQMVDWSSGGYLGFNASTIVNSGSNYTSYMAPWSQRITLVGAANPDGGANLTGSIRELVVYQGVTLDSNTIYSVEGYLAWKWGMTARLPSNHPYKTFDIRTSTIVTVNGIETVDDANNLVLQPANYLSRVALSNPTTTPNTTLFGHNDIRQTFLDMQVFNTGIQLFPIIGTFGTTYRLPYASGGINAQFPLFISSNDVGGYWEFYNNSGSNQTIAVTNGNGAPNILLTPFATARVTWTGTSNFLTYTTPWPSFLTQDAGNNRLGVNVTPAYSLDVTGSARFTSNVGIGMVPNTGTTALDVTGIARFQSVSTLQTFTSSMNGPIGFSSTIMGPYFSTQQLFTCTVQATSLSTLSFNVSTINGIIFTAGVSAVLSTSQLLTSSLNASTICSITANFSTISTTALVFGDGTGFVDMGDLLTTSISSILTYTGALYSTSNFLGTASSLTTLAFWGLQGNYNNTVLAETSTGTGFQEFLIFRGSSPQDRIRTQTTGTIVFESGMPQRLFSTTQVASNSTPTMILTSTSVGIFLSTPQASLDVGGTARAQILSTLNLNISSINNAAYPPVGSQVGAVLSTSRFLTSSVQASSISSFQAYFSTLTIESLTVGTGTGWFDLGPVRATAVSSIQMNSDSNFANNVFVGNQSSFCDIAFFGLQGNYNNTVLAEISTGTGIQEFLVFKGSSVSDRIRMQTTGTIVFEPGVSARLFSTPAQVLANATPAMLIDTASNVGIKVASVGAGNTLDVGGQGRFQVLSSQNTLTSTVQSFTLSTLSMYAGAIYGGVFFG